MSVRFEPRDIDPGSLGCIGLVFILSLILSTLATILLYRAFSIRTQITEGPISAPMPTGEKTFPNPQLQFYPPEDLAKFRKKEDATLNSYRWLNRTEGIVSIPIQRAMDLVVQQGEPVLGTPNLPQGPTWVEMMQRRAEQGKDAPP